MTATAGEHAEPPPRTSSRLFFVPGLALLAGISAAMALYATREGIGLSPDADTYLAMARHLAAGQGLSGAGAAQSQPLAHYPPLYPLILAGFARAGVDMLLGARLLNAGAFAAVVVLAGLIFRRELALDFFAALLGAAMVALSRDLLYVKAMLLSDGLFLVLLMLAWMALGSFLRSNRLATLLLAGVAIALAMLTRYAGAALGVAAAVSLVAYGRRWRDALLLGVVSALPLGLWIVRNVSATGSATNRPFAFHPPAREQWQRAAETVAQWLWATPKSWMIAAGVITVMTLATIAALSARNARREGRADPGPLGGAMLIFALFYALLVLVTASFLDANVRFDFRILAPLQLALAMPVFAELARSRLPRRFAAAWPVVMVTVFAIFLTVQAARAVTFARQAPELYAGYSMLKWRDSDTLRFVNHLPPDALIYTNATALLRLQTGRTVRQVPAVIDPRTLQPVPELDRRLRAMERELQARGGYVVYFDAVRRPALISSSQLEQEMKLRSVYRGRDGEVLQLRTRQRD